MKLGLGPINLHGATRTQLLSLAERAVSSSFDGVWVAESRSDGAGGALAAAAMIAQTVPIRVGAAVEVGLCHPLHLAEDIAVADLAAQGRIDVLARLKAPLERDLFEEHLRVLTAALSGAHIRWTGRHLRVPAHLEANQPAPDRLALNPRPAQPAVPIWIECTAEWMEALARDIGFGVAARWERGANAPRPSGRWPGLALCPLDVEALELLSAAGEQAAYFVVDANTPDEVRAVGARLVGPLRMPEFPDWIVHD